MSRAHIKSPERVTIFKVNQLGDNVVFLPVIEQLLVNSYFDSITLWTTPVAEPLYRQFQSRLRIEVVKQEDFYPAWKNPSKLLRLIHRVRKARSDLALIAEDMGNTAYLLATLSGAHRRIGVRLPYLKIPYAINFPVCVEPASPAAEKAWSLGRALAGNSRRVSWPDSPPAPDLSHLESSLKGKSLDILIHAGASREYKRWPLERYLELANRLSRDFKVGWFALPEAPLPSATSVTIIHPQRLEDLVSHLRGTSLFVGNNSGPMNIASALGTPSVIFNGPSTRSWDPYWHRERFRILRHESLPCIACDPPGLPIRQICTNHLTPMACMDFWTVEKVETEVQNWFQIWKTVTPTRDLQKNSPSVP